MKKLFKIIAVLLAAVLMQVILAGVTAADEWGRPDNYATNAFPQKYGRIGADINFSTLTESLKLTMTADKKTLGSGKITFTLNISGVGEDLAVNAVGVIPVYDTHIFNAVAEGIPEGRESRLIGGFRFDKKPAVETSKWAESMSAYAVAAGWQSGDPLYIPTDTDKDFYSFSLDPKKNAKGPSLVQAYVTFKYGELEYSRLVGITVGGEDRRITSASVTVGNGLTLKVKAVLGEISSAPYMLFNMEGQGERLVLGEFVNGLWQFELTGIGFEHMTDRIGFRLFSDGNAVDSRNGFTVKTYAEAVLESSAKEEAKVLAGRMLMFGEKVQLYKDYRTDELPTEGVEALSNEELFPEFEAPEKRGGVIEGDEATRITGTRFDFLGGFEYTFDVENPGEELIIGFDDGGEEPEKLYYSVLEENERSAVKTVSVSILDMERTVLFDNGGGNTVSVCGADFIADAWESETEGELAKALYALYLAARDMKSLGG